MVTFYHVKSVGMLKLEYNSPNLANLCLRKYISASLYPVTKATKTYRKTTMEHLDGQLSIVFKRKTVAVDTLISKS